MNSNTRYTVETVEEWKPRGQFTKITFHVIDTEDNDREVAVFPDGMHRDAQDMADDLNNGGPEPTDRAYAEQWRDYR